QQLGPDGQPIDTAALENAIPAPGVAAPAEGAQAPGTTVLGGATQIGPQGSARNEATINYEVDRTISHVKDAVGQLRRLSVAVVVNYREVDGEPQPLPEAEERKSVGQGKSADRG